MPKKRQGNFLPQLRIADIKSENLLKDDKRGSVIWRSPFFDFAIDFKMNHVCIGEDNEGYINIESLTFMTGDGKTSVEKIDKTILLVSTPGTLGGRRFWFLCPICDERAGVLFFHNKELACRKCHNLSYRSQNTRNRVTPLATLDKLRNNVGRTYYNGKPTKTYLRYQNKRKQTMKSLSKLTGSINKKLKKLEP